jgi:hypothetical protein
VDKEFAATVRVGPSRGRRNAAFLIDFLREDRAPCRLQLVATSGTWMDVDMTEGHSGERQILFRRYRPRSFDEPPDVVGRFRYAGRADLAALRLTDVVKKQKRKFVSDLLSDLDGLYATTYANATLRDWKTHLSSTTT